MRTLTQSRQALTISAAAVLLAGCGGSQPPIGAPGAMPQSHATATRAARGESWMLPEAESENLMYVSDPGLGGVVVYSYQPPRYKFVGFLSDPSYPLGECVDKAQDVFITSGGAIFEYPHGGSSPVRILGDPAGTPNSCAVDPVTGNLAVTAGGRTISGSIALAVYKNGKGKPTLYQAPQFNYMLFCSYDAKGNLFVDGGTAASNAFLLAELPKGGTTFTMIGVDQPIESPAGGVEWYGRHLLVGDNFKKVIYKYNIKAHQAKEVAAVSLTGAFNVVQFLVRNSRLISPSGNIEGRSGFVALYQFPQGGSPVRNLSNFSGPYAVVVSSTPPR